MKTPLKIDRKELIQKLGITEHGYNFTYRWRFGVEVVFSHEMFHYVEDEVLLHMLQKHLEQMRMQFYAEFTRIQKELAVLEDKLK